MELISKTFAELDTVTLYRILQLRVDVFVVEQECAYPEIDGRDPEPGTVHVYAQDGGEIVGYLRILEDQDGKARIGRVLTAKQARGTGLGGQLMRKALEIIGDRPSVLDAQSHLVGFYETFGFTASGESYVEDGIPHTPMAR
ncbi:GNAT family N-acetyltransferase [Hamadaea tsunoensis]|uniref:GNAT family N-acetyltransferase n=1 Tax=Hamadaea tsunoensis TaxID=53368 RepID=UPI000418AE46|nr:GNAT family N-acetyltransferase [Hamadaea tsunoensis]